MEYIYLGAIIGLCLFNLWSYRRGLKDGLALNQGKPIEHIQNPVQAVQSHMDKRHEQKIAKDEESKLAEGLANMMAYDGTPQKAKEGEK